jgi:hypothetical protein
VPDYNLLIDELLEYEGDGLTAWDVEFVDSLDKQRRGNPDWEPTGKQAAVLDRIAEKM